MKLSEVCAPQRAFVSQSRVGAPPINQNHVRPMYIFVLFHQSAEISFFGMMFYLQKDLADFFGV
jgi:hypothetical protein